LRAGYPCTGSFGRGAGIDTLPGWIPRRRRAARRIGSGVCSGGFTSAKQPGARIRALLNYKYRRVSTTSVSPGFDETALVARAKAGDQTAFNELVQQYDRRVFRMAKQITENDDDAEDVLQETFLKAYTHLDDFQGNSKFYTWLVRIAVNEALMKLRKRRSDRTVPLDEPIDTGEDEVVREIAVWDQNPEDVYSRDELAGILDQAVKSLKTAYRTVFILRDIEEMSIEETAETLGLSISAVKSRLLRARLQLREKLTRQFKKKGDDAFAYL
jgi:RNA polymerase sigma-70 factor, ECF subfamily